MSLLSRINRLAVQLGADDKPKGVVITTDGRRHGITFGPNGFLSMRVPWDPMLVDDPRSDVMDTLKPEHKTLIGPHDHMCALVMLRKNRDSGFENPNTRMV